MNKRENYPRTFAGAAVTTLTRLLDWFPPPPRIPDPAPKSVHYVSVGFGVTFGAFAQFKFTRGVSVLFLRFCARCWRSG